MPIVKRDDEVLHDRTLRKKRFCEWVLRSENDIMVKLMTLVIHICSANPFSPAICERRDDRFGVMHVLLQEDRIFSLEWSCGVVQPRCITCLSKRWVAHSSNLAVLKNEDVDKKYNCKWLLVSSWGEVITVASKRINSHQNLEASSTNERTETKTVTWYKGVNSEHSRSI